MKFLRILLVASSLGSGGILRGGEVDKVVLVLLREAGWEQWGISGNPEARTPRLDRLAGESVLLTDFHGQPLEAPALAAALTGREPRRSGVWADSGGRHQLAAGADQLGGGAAAAGAVTGWFGTWGMGDVAPCRPEDHGFTEVLTHGGRRPGAMGDALGNGTSDLVWRRQGGRLERVKGTGAAACFGAARHFLQMHAARPLLCVISPPPAPLSEVDGHVGELVEDLGSLGLLSRTLLVVTSLTGSAAAEKAGGFTAGRRGSRGEPWEGGHAVPCLWRWPDKTRAGERDGGLTSLMDLAPTLAGVTGWKLMASDGMDLGDVLRGRARVPADRFLVVEAQDVPWPQRWRRTAAMRGGWRLVNGEELHDLSADPGQRRPLEGGAEAAALAARYDTWWEAIGRLRPEVVPLRCGGADPVMLTAADWQARGPRPIGQEAMVKGERLQGWWAVVVPEETEAEFTLRRWPLGVARPIAGEGYPAAKARLRVGTVDLTKPVPDGAAEVLFKAKLPAGRGRLQAWFEDADGGAAVPFHVEVRRPVEVRAAKPVEP